MSTRRSPAQFRSRVTSVVVFVVCMSLLSGAVFLGYRALSFDYSGYIPFGSTPRPFIPEGGFKEVKPENAMELEEYVEPTMTPRPTLAPTPIPLELYAIRDTKVLMTGTDKLGEVALTLCVPSAADNNRVMMVRGWGYIRGTDAALSNIFLAVSTKSGEDHRFYRTIRQSGSTGIQHDPSTGKNLDQADFVAAFAVDTYDDGIYRLGLLIEALDQSGKKIIERAYYPLGDEYLFTVSGGKIQ
jgi:hypothetical protein